MSELQIVGVFDPKSSQGNFRFQFSGRRVAAVPLMCLMLGACTPEKATVRLKDDFQVGTVSIIHARFPCHSPDLHFFWLQISSGCKPEICLRRHLLGLFKRGSLKFKLGHYPDGAYLANLARLSGKPIDRIGGTRG